MPFEGFYMDFEDFYMVSAWFLGLLKPWKESKGSQEECYVVLRGVSRAKGVYALENMKTTQQDGLYTYGRKFMQRNEYYAFGR